MYYGNLLKLLIKITHLKSKDLSQDLHYDSSYFSKWLNGHHLPTLAQVESTNSYLSNRFADVIYRNNLQDEVRGFLPNNLDLGSKVILRKTIYNALNSSYIKSFCKRDENLLEVSESPFQTIVGLDAIRRFLFSIYSKPLGPEKVSLFYHINYSYLRSIFDSYKNLLLFSNETPVDVHFILDNSGSFFTSNNFYDIYNILTEMIYYDMFIYSRTVAAGQPEFIYVRNHFVLYFHMDENGLPLICNYSTDPAILEQTEAYLASLNLPQHTLMKTIDDPYFEVDFFQENNYRNYDFHIFASFFDGSFLNESLVTKILKRNRVKSFDSEVLKNTLKLKTTTYRNGNMTITINSVPFFRSLREHKLALASHVLKINNDDMKKCIDLMSKGLESMTSSHFYMIDPYANDPLDWDFPLSFYMTKHTFVAKKLDVTSKCQFKYIVSSNPEFVKLLRESFDLIRHSDYAKEIIPLSIEERLMSIYHTTVALGDE